MAFSSLLGQPTAQRTLEHALRTRQVHHAYRFEGPDGVGKETAALLLAQALVCTSHSPLGCEECSACVRARKWTEETPRVPLHPDVVIVERGLYPSAVIGGSSEATGISVEQIRHIVQPRVGLPPHEERALCILIRRAEELTQAAANALLKTLEEPPPKTHFILLTSRPGRLLDTIRSRTLAIRFGPLQKDALLELLKQENLPTSVAAHSGGSLARARAQAEPEERARRDDFVSAADAALQAEHSAAALAFADARPEGRERLRELLLHLGTVFAERARSGGSEMAVWAHRHGEIQQALTETERNASPALVLESLMLRMRATPH